MCAEQIQDEAIKCKHCHHSLVTAPERKVALWALIATIGILVLFYPAKSLLATLQRNNAIQKYNGCKSNVTNIGTALEMWCGDHQEQFPPSLNDLMPKYLKSIPTCPAANADTYSGDYRLEMPPYSKMQVYRFHCAGHFHKECGVGQNRPEYSGIEGLLP